MAQNAGEIELWCWLHGEQVSGAFIFDLARLTLDGIVSRETDSAPIDTRNRLDLARFPVQLVKAG
jgi:hypothetical protein